MRPMRHPTGLVTGVLAGQQFIQRDCQVPASRFVADITNAVLIVDAAFQLSPQARPKPSQRKISETQS